MNVATILKMKGSDVATARADASVMEIVKDLAEHGVGAMVIVDDDGHVTGIISERDVVRAISKRGNEALTAPTSEVMTHDVVTCSEEDTVADLMEQMTDGRFRHLPVIVNGKLGGIVSIGDVVKQRIAEAEQEAAAMRAYIATG